MPAAKSARMSSSRKSATCRPETTGIRTPHLPVWQNDLLTIGKIARIAQVSVDTVRFYEKEGLLSPARKSGAGYRLYNEEAVRRLNFIRHAQHCGLALAEIRELLELRSRDNTCCTDVRGLAIRKKLQLENKIRSLRAMSRALSRLIDVCTDGSRPLDECPILAELEASLNPVTSTRRTRARPVIMPETGVRRFPKKP